jgi:heavy metal translocating P-type ATPase
MSPDAHDATDAGTPLLSGAEQRRLGLQLVLSLAAAGCLLVALAIRAAAPDQRSVAELVAGVAALMVAVPALSAAWHSLRHPDLHGITDQLIGLALVAAWATGDLVTATLLPLVMMVGHVLEERSLLGSQEAIQALIRLTRIRARRVLGDGGIEELSAQALRTGDLIEVRAGDRIAADGVVESGESSVDTASLTGESVPVEVRAGDALFGGSINLDGLLRVRVTRVGDDATLGRVIALMQEAEHAKPPVTRLLEKYAGRYMLLVLLVAAAAWFVTHSATAMLAVLVACCPCAIVLAAPATAVAAVAVASRHGILVKGAAFLEQLGTVDTVVLDKTGTVTLGQLKLAGVLPEPGVERAAMLALAGSLGEASTHPVSRALASLVPDDARLPVAHVRETRGLGIVGFLEGGEVAMGRADLFDELRIAAPAPPAHDGPVAGLARDGRFLGWLLLADEARPEARAAVADLRALGLARQILLTGDRRSEAERIAQAIDLPEVRADALPAQKMQCVLDLVAEGRRPLVVGDGINDALALKAGAVGAAMGAQGSDVALASADLVLMTNDLRRLGTCIRLSRRCRRTIYANVAIGMGWTALVVGLAGLNVFGAGAPLAAAIMHNVGTLLVMGNAGRLLKFHEEPARPAT